MLLESEREHLVWVKELKMEGRRNSRLDGEEEQLDGEEEQ